ncbi:uncharacterized protein [Arachis hypogaea]|uniref:uncharacterized protein n=1 Tax=Arachis hypogaea TaxID=3818 RepID=UPI000DEC3D8B|nr:uncharacterized protein LOC112709532 [Arachis hypogaea]
MRFTEAAMQIPDLNSEVQLHAIKSELCPGKFREAIAVAKSKILEEFREKAQGQIEIEELREARRNKRPTRKEEERPHRPTSKDPRKPFKLAPKFDSYTKLNTKREDIIKEIFHNKLIKPPIRAGSYQDQKYVDRSKHCAFHQKFGHTIDECVVAKDLLERLARQGLLDKYISSRKQHDTEREVERESKQKQVVTPPSKGIINYISGGFASGKNTTSARKRSYRAMMTMEGSHPDNAVGTIYVDHKEARQCYNASLKAVKKEEIPRIHTVYN